MSTSHLASARKKNHSLNVRIWFLPDGQRSARKPVMAPTDNVRISSEHRQPGKCVPLYSFQIATVRLGRARVDVVTLDVVARCQNA